MVGLTGEGAQGGGWGLAVTPPAAAAQGWRDGRDGGMAPGTALGWAGRRREGARPSSSQPFRAAHSLTPS